MTRHPAPALLLGFLIGLAGCAAEVAPSASPSPTAAIGREHQGHQTLPPDATPIPDRHSDGLELVATLPKADHSFDFFHSDLAFWGDLAVQGSYDGFRLIDISRPRAPRVVADVECRGPQGDVSIWETLVFVSVDRPQTTPACDSQDAFRADPLFVPDEGGWEGVRIFDVSEPSRPELVASVSTDCGSHTHTLVPDPEAGRVLLYVSSYALQQDPDLAPDCVNPHGHISVVEVPLADPAAARVVSRPHLFDTPAWEVWPGAPPEFHDTAGCHDISLYLPLRLAAAACMSEGQIWDIRDPERPVAIAHLDLPDVSFWHSATWSNDGSVVAFGDENLAEE
ncbi:MAG: LVIVD repeat-containing protein, partial [Candidatus Limnocylindria bacterium]